MPEEVRSVVDVIGSSVRTEILRRLSNQPLTALELADQVGAHFASIHRHLTLLEDLGLVSTDVGRGRRRGQTVTWRTNKAKVHEFGSTWINYASGE